MARPVAVSSAARPVSPHPSCLPGRGVLNDSSCCVSRPLPPRRLHAVPCCLSLCVFPRRQPHAAAASRLVFSSPCACCVPCHPQASVPSCLCRPLLSLLLLLYAVSLPCCASCFTWSICPPSLPRAAFPIFRCVLPYAFVFIAMTCLCPPMLRHALSLSLFLSLFLFRSLSLFLSLSLCLP